MSRSSLVLVLLIVGCLSKDQVWIEKEIVGPLNWNSIVEIGNQNQSLSIKNDRSREIRFNLKLNHRFPMSTREMIGEIKAGSLAHDRSEVMSAWRFVTDNTYHSTPLTSEAWAHDSFTFMNSLAGGFCDDRSSVLVGLWQRMGYKARVIGLGGHVVPEVFDQGHWRLFDPDHEVYYIDEEDNIVGVERLENSACEGLSTVGSNEFQKTLWECGTPRMVEQAALYTSTENNENLTAWHLAFNPLEDYAFRLPRGAELLISTDFESGSSSLWVELRDGSEGDLRIPLVPFALSGNAELRVRGRVFESSEEEIVPLTNIGPGELLVVERIDGQAMVHFLINPSIGRLTEVNEIEIKGATGPLLIGASAKMPAVVDEVRRGVMRFELVKHKYRLRLAEMPKILEVASVYGLKREYFKFLNLESGLDTEHRMSLLEDFETDLERVRNSLELTDEEFINLVANRYPESALMIFLVMRHDAYYYLRTVGPRNSLYRLNTDPQD